MTKSRIKLPVTLLLCAALCLCASAALADGGISVTYVERSWDGSQVVTETKTATVQPVPSNGSMTEG